MGINTPTVIFVLFACYMMHKYFHQPVRKLFVTCDSTSDTSCKMYNVRDINSKCSSMCHLKYPDSVFTGNHHKTGETHTCVCSDTIEPLLLLDDNNHSILGAKVQEDSLFTDRNYVENTEHDRLQRLIFG